MSNAAFAGSYGKLTYGILTENVEIVEGLASVMVDPYLDDFDIFVWGDWFVL